MGENDGGLLGSINLENLIKPENVNGIEGILKNIDKYGGALEKIDKMLSRIQKLANMPLVSTAVAVYAKKNDVSVIQEGVSPTSEIHRTLYNALNGVPEKQIGEIVITIQNILKPEKEAKTK